MAAMAAATTEWKSREAVLDAVRVTETDALWITFDVDGGIDELTAAARVRLRELRDRGHTTTWLMIPNATQTALAVLHEGLTRRGQDHEFIFAVRLPCPQDANAVAARVMLRMEWMRDGVDGKVPDEFRVWPLGSIIEKGDEK